MIIIIISIILLLLTSFLYIQKKKVMSLQQQIGDLQNKISILEKQYLAAEQYKDSLKHGSFICFSLAGGDKKNIHKR